jgi:ankyrin repeat protein
MSGLMNAAYGGDLVTVKRMLADGTASIDERESDGSSALIVAADGGQLATVQWLLAFGGASIDEATHEGVTSLQLAAFGGHTALTQWLVKKGGTRVTDAGLGDVLIGGVLAGRYMLARWLLEEGGASMTQSSTINYYAWDALIESVSKHHDNTDLAALLKVMVMLEDAPANMIAKLSPEHVEIATRGRQLRAQLPSYLERQQGLVMAHCPLHAVLTPLVVGYAAPTAEDMWADGGLCI